MTRREKLVAIGSDSELAKDATAEQAAADETLILDEPVEEVWED